MFSLSFFLLVALLVLGTCSSYPYDEIHLQLLVETLRYVHGEVDQSPFDVPKHLPLGDEGLDTTLSLRDLFGDTPRARMIRHYVHVMELPIPPPVYFPSYEVTGGFPPLPNSCEGTHLCFELGLTTASTKAMIRKISLAAMGDGHLELELVYPVVYEPHLRAWLQSLELPVYALPIEGNLDITSVHEENDVTFYHSEHMKTFIDTFFAAGCWNDTVQQLMLRVVSGQSWPETAKWANSIDEGAVAPAPLL